MHLISVIVPVYKVEQYLNKCVESILGQTFSDFELILVDDGSPDNCPQMCDDWAKRDNRIRVIHQENGGLLDAVRQGVKLAEGEYICFVDSDDWVEREFLQVLYDGITEHRADVAHCNYQRVIDGVLYPRFYSLRIYEEEEIQNTILPQMSTFSLPQMTDSRCTKIYRASFVKEGIALCDTREKVISEDFLLNFAVFGICKRIVVLDTPPLYNYFYNEASITGNLDLDRFLHQDAFYEILETIAKTYNCLSENIDLVKTRKYASYIYAKAITDQSRVERKREIQRIIDVLDRKLWLQAIKTSENMMERIGSYLYYLGQIDLMLILMDIKKRITGNK